MKQLKFMLAAATAIGLATAAQATETPMKEKKLINNENFDEVVLKDGEFARDMPGYSYSDPDNLADDESTISTAAEGYNNTQSLKVNTGTNALLRALDVSGSTARPISLTAEKSLYIDTMVKFTVTPYGDEVEASKDENGAIKDKLMIYLKECVGSVSEDGATTNFVNKLMVKAAKYKTADFITTFVPTFEESDVEISNAEVVAGTWYNLRVTSYVENGITLFTIKLGDTELASLEPLYTDDAKKIFPALTGNSDTTLTYVGFAGEGMIDNLTVATLEPQTSVDFTLALGDGVNAVTWTINEAEKSGEGSASFAAGTTIVVSIDSVTYDAGYAGTEDWTAWTYNKAESGSIKITAEKFAEVSDTGVVTPTDATIKAVTGGSFKVPAVGGDVTAEEVAEATANLGKALTWATASGKGGKSYTAAIEAINTMNFVDDNETTTEQAYLLDCSTGELGGENGEIAKFKFVGFDLTTGFTVGKDKQVANGKAYGNGYVEVRGDTAVNGAYTEAADTTKHSFFKAFLVPFQPAAAEVE